MEVMQSFFKSPETKMTVFLMMCIYDIYEYITAEQFKRSTSNLKF